MNLTLLWHTPPQKWKFKHGSLVFQNAAVAWPFVASSIKKINLSMSVPALRTNILLQDRDHLRAMPRSRICCQPWFHPSWWFPKYHTNQRFPLSYYVQQLVQLLFWLLTAYSKHTVRVFDLSCFLATFTVATDADVLSQGWLIGGSYPGSISSKSGWTVTGHSIDTTKEWFVCLPSRHFRPHHHFVFLQTVVWCPTLIQMLSENVKFPSNFSPEHVERKTASPSYQPHPTVLLSVFPGIVMYI